MSGERKNFHFIMHILKFWCELGSGGGVLQYNKVQTGNQKDVGNKNRTTSLNSARTSFVCPYCDLCTIVGDIPYMAIV